MSTLALRIDLHSEWVELANADYHQRWAVPPVEMYSAWIEGSQLLDMTRSLLYSAREVGIAGRVILAYLPEKERETEEILFKILDTEMKQRLTAVLREVLNAPNQHQALLAAIWKYSA